MTLCLIKNGSIIFSKVPDLTTKGYSAGAGLLFLQKGWQDKQKPQKGMGKTHIEHRHKREIDQAGAATAEDYVGMLLSMPYRIYDLARDSRLLIFRPVKPIGGVIIAPAAIEDRETIILALQNSGPVDIRQTIYVVISAFNKRNAEGNELWIQRR